MNISLIGWSHLGSLIVKNLRQPWPMQKLICPQCHWYCEVVLVQTNPFGVLLETIIVVFFGGQGCNIRRCCRPEGTQDVWKDYRFYGNPSKYQYWRYLVISIKEPNPRFVIDMVWCNSKRILIFENDVEYYEYWQQESDSHHSSSCFWKTVFWSHSSSLLMKIWFYL